MQITCPCLDTTQGENEIKNVHDHMHALIAIAIEHYHLCPSAVAEIIRRTAKTTLTPKALLCLNAALETTTAENLIDEFETIGGTKH